MENLAVLKKEFISTLSWDEEEGLTCGDGKQIREFLKAYAEKIAKDENLIIEIKENEYSLNFSDDGEFIDFQIDCKLEGDLTNGYYLTKKFNTPDEEITYTYVEYDEDENKTTFTLYTSVQTVR